MLRVGTAVVLADSRLGVVARVEDRDGDRRAERQTVVARLLKEADVPAVRLFDAGQSPIVVHPGVEVLLWHREQLTDERATVADIAGLARRLHEVVPLGSIDGREVPAFDPIAAVLAQLGDAPGPAEDVEVLRSAAQVLADVWPGDEPGRIGIVHGDLHAGNVLMTARGPVLADLELAGVGPVAHDLVAPVVAADRYGAPATDLLGYERAYGAPIPDAARNGPLRDAYELWLTAWAVANRRLDDAHDREAEVRMQRWRTPDGELPRWTLR